MVFKDRAACCCRDFVPPCFSAAPHSTSGAAFFISNRLFCQAAVAASLHRFASTLFRRGGAEPTSLPPSLSTHFVDPSLPPVRLSSSGAGRRLLPPPRQVSTPLVDFVFRLSLLLGRGLRRQCDFAFPSEGRGFYHHRVRSQPPSSTLFFPSTRPPSPLRRPPFRGAAVSTTAAFGVNRLPRPHHTSEQGYLLQPAG